MCLCKKDAQGCVDLLWISAASYRAAVANLWNAMVQSGHKWHSANGMHSIVLWTFWKGFSVFRRFAVFEGTCLF